MRLSWNEIRARAAAFARKWKGAGYAKNDPVEVGIEEIGKRDA